MLTPAESEALLLSLRVSAVAVLCALPFALAAALLLARHNFFGRSLVEGVLHLPLALPPVVVGYLLLVMLGPREPLGAWLEAHLHIRFAFSWTGAALASALITFPFQYRAIRLGVQAQDAGLAEAAATLGAVRPLCKPHLSARAARNHRWRDHGVCRQPWRIRRDHHLRFQHSWRDAYAAACDLQRLAAAGRRKRSDAARRALRRIGARRRGARRSRRPPPACVAYPMSLQVTLRHRLGAFRLQAKFEVERPGITALFGPSGAGKTTIIDAIAGLLRPDEGRIIIDGETVLDTAARIFVPARLRRTGYVFQDARLFPHLSVEANLRFGWRRADRRATQTEFDEILDLLGLEAMLARKPAKLSGGEKSRVALGRALLAAPRLLLLDEPLAALDEARKAEILPYLERLRDRARLPMIYVTHSVDEVSRLADAIIVLDRGTVAAQGSVFDLLSDPDLGALVPAHGAVFPACVAEHRSDGLTALAFDGGTLLVPRVSPPVGAPIRVRLRADDVMLALAAPQAISANNVLPAQVIAIHAAGDANADIRLLCGGVRLVARITRASQTRLGLAPGAHVSRS